MLGVDLGGEEKGWVGGRRALGDETLSRASCSRFASFGGALRSEAVCFQEMDAAALQEGGVNKASSALH